MGGGQVATLDKDSFAGSDWRSTCLSVVVWLGRMDLVLGLCAKPLHGQVLRQWMGQQLRQLLDPAVCPALGKLPRVGSGLPSAVRGLRVVRSRGLDGGGSSCYPE